MLRLALAVLLPTVVHLSSQPLSAQPMTRTWSDFTGPMTLLGREKAKSRAGEMHARRVPVFTLEASRRYAGTRAVAALLSPQRTAIDSLLLALASASGAPPRSAIAKFVASYAEMGPEPTRRSVMQAAMRFNELVQVASGSFLAEPVEEFVAVRAVLQELLSKTNAK